MSVKKLLSCILAIFMISVFVLPCFAAEPVLSIKVSDSKVKKGDVFTVTVSISPESKLTNLDFTVNFNTTEFEYIAGTSNVNASGVFETAESNFTLTPGVVQFTGNSTVGASNGGVLISMQMKVIKPDGVFSLSVNNATDINGNTVTVKKTSAELRCSHETIEWKPTTPATCSSEGIETGICDCGAYTTTRKIEKIAHVPGEPKVEKEPTCTETGLQVEVCTVCKETVKETVMPATGHEYEDWVVKTEPTPETIGLKERVCRNCDDKQTQMVAYDKEDESSTDESASEDLTAEYESDTMIPDIELEPTTEAPKDLLSVMNSQRMVIVVLALAAFVAISLVVYMVLLARQKKK